MDPAIPSEHEVPLFPSKLADYTLSGKGRIYFQHSLFSVLLKAMPPLRTLETEMMKGTKFDISNFVIQV